VEGAKYKRKIDRILKIFPRLSNYVLFFIYSCAGSSTVAKIISSVS
jgi:hypothetical protein